MNLSRLKNTITIPFAVMTIATVSMNSAELEKNAEDIEFTIRTLKARMRYDIENFTVRPGQRVKLTLVNEDDMPHNLVLCELGEETGQEIGKLAIDLGLKGVERGWVPDDPRILCAIGETPPKKSASINFTAPEVEGDYPYVCTFPGHAAFMKGIMKVGFPQTSLRGLNYAVYNGRWSRLPDFEKIKPIRKGQISDGIITLKTNSARDAFGVVYKAKLKIKEEGNYRFRLGSDDGSKLLINEKITVNHDGTHGFSHKDASVNLQPGIASFELQFFEAGGDQKLELLWAGPGFEWQYLTNPDEAEQAGVNAVIPLEPLAKEPVIYRNFIEGAGTRAIGIGYPDKFNIAFDANRCRLALMWLGGFMDAGRHWIGRGQGFQPPLGYGIIRLPEGQTFIAVKEDLKEWPEPNGRAVGLQFLGYDLDENRRPIFRYRAENGIKIYDAFIPGEGDIPSLTRKIKLFGDGQLHYLVAQGAIEPLQDGKHAIINRNLIVKLNSPEGRLRLINRNAESQLIATISISGKAELSQTYEWNF